ncbi:hypothetical protein [Sphingomonas sp. CV7422]|uniref:hypothetical protein n=1 Tax=Sphingomonas sp. CV7422 TaxID=3018036 RepID=UPI0022FDC8B0|nr:hypothetical protein [Sphingomonas sp. CV7422]
MPFLKRLLSHAFSAKSWAAIGGLIVGGWATLWQLSLKVDDTDFVIMAGAMTVLALGSWIALITEGFAADKAKISAEQEFVRLHLKLDDMAIHLAANPTRMLSVRNLENEPNGRVARLVFELTRSMREWALDYAERRSATIYLPSRNREEWEEGTRKMMAQSAQDTAEFNERFRPEALALRHEMQRRLGGRYTPAHRHTAVALDHGMLAGVNPVDEAAAYLEDMARQLPD